tara:strand:- start:471 stop:941 length:471 start_codon:yes stop_codon:yes gene_type:complete
MTEEDHFGLVAKFLPVLAKEAKEGGVVCGNVTTRWYITKGVGKHIEMSYVFPKNETSRIEMRIFCGPKEEDDDIASEIYEHFKSKKPEIEKAYGGSLTWEKGKRRKGKKRAYYIRQKYSDFQVSDVSRWGHWIERIVTDMSKLDDALTPHYINSRN